MSAFNVFSRNYFNITEIFLYEISKPRKFLDNIPSKMFPFATIAFRTFILLATLLFFKYFLELPDETITTDDISPIVVTLLSKEREPLVNGPGKKHKFALLIHHP